MAPACTGGNILLITHVERGDALLARHRHEPMSSPGGDARGARCGARDTERSGVFKFQCVRREAGGKRGDGRRHARTSMLRVS